MNDRTDRYWFPAKRYGWGWGPPTTWQGWFVLVLWFAILIPISTWLAPMSLPWFFAFITTMTAAIVGIAYVKGEPSHWRPVPLRLWIMTGALALAGLVTLLVAICLL